MDFRRKTPAQKQWATINQQAPIGDGTTPRDQALARYRHELGLLTPFAERNAQELGAHVEFVTYRIALQRLITALETPTDPIVTGSTRRKMFKRGR